MAVMNHKFKQHTQKSKLKWVRLSILISFLIAVLIFFFKYQNNKEQQLVVQRFFGGDRFQTIAVHGQSRSFLLHIPILSIAHHPKPLLILLHGTGSNAEDLEEMLHINDLADKERFIVAYPNGIDSSWNAGNCCGSAHAHQVDDVKFIRLIIEQIKKEYRIIPNRIYAAGLSNGGMMAYRLACELSDQMAAVASVAGAMDVDVCRPTQQVSIIAIHGMADETVLYQGGISKKDSEKNYDQPVSRAVHFWVRRNGCLPISNKEQRLNVIRESYKNEHTGVEVLLYSILGKGHEWPGLTQGTHFSELKDKSQQLSASQEVLDFFKTHPKKE